MKKKICILGSTGSIGKSTLEIISKNSDFENFIIQRKYNKARKCFINCPTEKL